MCWRSFSHAAGGVQVHLELSVSSATLTVRELGLFLDTDIFRALVAEFEKRLIEMVPSKGGAL